MENSPKIVNLKTLLIANCILALILVACAIWFVKTHREPQIKLIDSTEYYKARFDSIVIEADELKHLIKVRSETELNTIQTRYAYKDSIIFLSDSAKLYQLKRILAILDSERFTYKR